MPERKRVKVPLQVRIDPIVKEAAQERADFEGRTLTSYVTALINSDLAKRTGRRSA